MLRGEVRNRAAIARSVSPLRTVYRVNAGRGVAAGRLTVWRGDGVGAGGDPDEVASVGPDGDSTAPSSWQPETSRVTTAPNRRARAGRGVDT